MTNSVHNNIRAGTLLIDPYWIGFFITNYQDGFRRRALIGTICRAIAPNGISVLAINLVALLTAGCLVVLLIRSFARVSSASSHRSILFIFAFFASVLVGTFTETLGDTLQLTFVLFLTGLLLANRAKLGVASRLILGLILVAIGFFIHEASLFFLIPALPFFIRSRPRLADFILPSVVFFGFLGLSVHWSHLQPHLTYRAILFPHQVPFTDLAGTPDFGSLLRTEAGFDFGSLHNGIRFLSKCVRLAALLFAGIVVVGNCMRHQAFGRFLVLLRCILLYNIPLWFIAHDWGRFLSYSFCFAIVGTAIWPSDKEPETYLIRTMSVAVRNVGKHELIYLAVLFLLFDSQTVYSRVTGISVRTLVPFILIAGLEVMRSRRSVHLRELPQ